MAQNGGTTVLRLSRLDGIPDQFIGGEILKVAYARIGIDLEFVALHPKRSLMESSEGRLDGEVQRILDVEHQFPTLIAVKPSINFIEPTAFVKQLSFEVRGWAALEPYSVGIVRGVGSSEAGTMGLPRVSPVVSMDALMKMLAAERIDVAVNDRLSGELVIRRLKLEGELHPLSPSLQRVPLYHFLHERHRQLIPRIEAVLREMQASGELEQIRRRLVKRMMEDGWPE